MSVIEKKRTLRSLDMGDIIKCTNGKEYEFIRMKRDKFLARRDGGMYDVPAQMFDQLVRKSEQERFNPSELQEGELFYILNAQQEAIVLRFQYMINVDKVHAENPITKQGYTLAAHMVKGAVRELVK